jgi:hypothetical protein
MILQQRQFQIFHQPAKAYWVLLVLRVVPVCWLVEREAGLLRKSIGG